MEERQSRHCILMHILKAPPSLNGDHRLHIHSGVFLTAFSPSGHLQLRRLTEGAVFENVVRRTFNANANRTARTSTTSTRTQNRLLAKRMTGHGEDNRFF